MSYAQFEMPIPVTWMGLPVESLAREELLEVIVWCASEIKALHTELDRWREIGDPIKYLQSIRTD